MFEKYAETARKAVFFARYAASQLGCEYIDAEHLLLGVLRADPPLGVRVFKTRQQVESIRERIEKQSPPREKISTSMDLPLSRESKRVLACAATEAERLNRGAVLTGHLLLAVLLEQECAGSKIMAQNGVTVADIEQAISDSSSAETLAAITPRLSAVPVETNNPGYRDDLTAAARSGALSPLIGRENELESIVRILSRRTRRNPVLVGEPGSEKPQ